MIGLVASGDELGIAAEFFELFKTPWELARQGKPYRALICTDGTYRLPDAPVTIRYGSARQQMDDETGVAVGSAHGIVAIDPASGMLPLYTHAALFDRSRDSTLTWQGKALTYCVDRGEQRHWRVGYDLFAEVGHLLTHGQPVEHARIPTLDHHIDRLRATLVDSGVPVVEVPPVPFNHAFACCLTHDVDFFGIRRHGLDATMAGFIGRATAGSVVDFVRRRRPVRDVARNVAAALSLPLVLLGARSDFWDPVAQYATANGGRPATFFVVPTRNHPGTAPDGVVHRGRAVRYEAADVSPRLRAAVAAGHEVALHGLDAWRDTQSASSELARVARASGSASRGVRMHWLYFDADSPARLDAAGFDYDSTRGYNEDVGFRTGTTQAFRAPGCMELMELPLSIMDTALFFPQRLGLSPTEGLERCAPLLEHAGRVGGALVVNWHDRSLAPERLWYEAYAHLLAEVDRRNAWYATAGDTVAWFRWRRAIRFEADGDALIVQADPASGRLPGAAVRVHGRTSVTEHRLDAGDSLRLTA
ncbi:MAG TPA: hypothetical protein VMF13_09530 [Luteitalea sp.]|nr:hypothetical protein [Luteitalea sp.]